MEDFSLLLPEIADAISKGFTDNYQLLQNGKLLCLRTGKFYENFHADFRICSLVPATLLLVTLENGNMGTAIEFWEHY